MTATAENIVAALEEQLACYRKLARLSEQQHELVRQTRTDDLLQLLMSRKDLLERLTALEPTVAPAKQDWPTFSKTLEPEGRKRAESLLNESRELLERINAADRDDVFVLQQQKLSLGSQIRQTGTAKRANARYAAAAYRPNAGKRLDRSQ